MLEWTSEFSVGVERLDDQHKRWLEIIKELEDVLASEDPESVPLASRALVKMIDYTRVHFSAEEELMLQTDYSEFEAHKALHEGFVKQVLGITAALRDGKVTTAEGLVQVARQWFGEHIQTVDKRYTDHFKAHGVT